MWTVAVPGKKKLRIRKYLDTCGRGLNLGGPSPHQQVVSARLKGGPRAETGGILVLRDVALMTDHETEGSGVDNEPSGRQNAVLFAGRKMASRS